MKIRQGLVTTVEAYFLYGFFSIEQLGTGIADTYFIQKINIRFPGTALKIITKSRYAHAGNFRNLFQADRFPEHVDGKTVNALNTGSVFQVIWLNLLRRNRVKIAAAGQHFQTFAQKQQTAETGNMFQIHYQRTKFYTAVALNLQTGK
jgi:hypothetical protein